ncbi:MAG TPA: hypothetical protein VIW01_08505 [Dehalococcoidia bacterium]
MTRNNLAANTLYSRRRSRATRQSGVPDWIWGAGLGVIALFFVGAFFLVRDLSGGGAGGTCNEPLSPLESSEITADAFANEEAALTRVISMLTLGDRPGAEAAFFGPVHNFTHNVDPPLRERDEDAAKELCEAVIEMENGFATNASTATIAAQIDLVRTLLRDAAETLGYPRPE